MISILDSILNNRQNHLKLTMNNFPVIICIDDERTILDSLRIELETHFADQYTIEIAENGQEGLDLIIELLEENQDIPLVISDYIMPDIKGDEVLKKIHELSPETVKIMLTGQADLEGVKNAINHAKLYRYIPKPWQAEDLKLTIQEALHSYLQAQQLAQRNQQLEIAYQEISQVNQDLEKSLQAQLDLAQAATKFVPREFLSLLGHPSIVDVQLGDSVKQHMSVLFADIRDFTTISEKMTPEANFQFINDYLLLMEPIIIENNGFIDKYIGDAIMALFTSSADDALKAAINMLKTLEAHPININNQKETVKIGIGINTGNLMLGIVGGQNRFDGTVTGDTVNLASRLQDLTRVYQVSLLISHDTCQGLKIPADYAIRLIDIVQVKGRQEKVSIFEVFSGDDPVSLQGKLASQTIFEQGIVFYQNQQYLEAIDVFQRCLDIYPGDSVAKLYLGWSQDMLVC